MAFSRRCSRDAACSSISCRERITSSAAADGVGARRSATNEAYEPSRSVGGPTASGDDDDINVVVPIEITHTGCNFVGGGLALNLGGIDHQVGGMVPAGENVENVPEGGSLRRSHVSNSRRERRYRLLAFGGEQALGAELGLAFRQPLHKQRQRLGHFLVFLVGQGQVVHND